MPDVGGPDAQSTSVTITTDEERELPGWVADPEESEKVWSVYNAYLRGNKPHAIADSHDVSVRTVHNYINRARAELPYSILNKAAEMVDLRMQWVQMAWRIAEAIDSSQLRIDRKAEQISKLLNSAGHWVTAVEELTGARRGTGSRISLQQGEGGQAAFIFDMDALMKGGKSVEEAVGGPTVDAPQTRIIDVEPS